MSLKAVVRFFNGTDETIGEILDFVDKATKKSALVMERNIKNTARSSFKQQTGNLRRSIRARDTDVGESEVVINPVNEGADVNYAIHLEYGTRYITPRAFIRKGVLASEQQINEIFGQESKNVKVDVGAV